MSGVVQAMTLLKATFDEYAGKDGDEDTMTKAELSEMLRNELPEGGVSRKDVVLLHHRAVNPSLPFFFTIYLQLPLFFLL